MQDNFSCAATPIGTTKKLIDSRDEQEYLVSRLPDGKCWMLDNLRLDPANQTTAANMNETNTNATNTAIANYLGTTFTPTTGWSTVAVADIDTGFDSYTEPMINNASLDYEVTSYGSAAISGNAKVGIYYNYCAATVGTYCYDRNSGVGNANYDLCPAGWRMPTGGANGEYQSLCNVVYGGVCTSGVSMIATDANSLQYNLSTPLSGYYYGSQANSRGNFGDFWSSTRYGSTGNAMYYLLIFPSVVYPQYTSFNRDFGLAMRCVH